MPDQVLSDGPSPRQGRGRRRAHRLRQPANSPRHQRSATPQLAWGTAGTWLLHGHPYTPSAWRRLSNPGSPPQPAKPCPVDISRGRSEMKRARVGQGLRSGSCKKRLVTTLSSIHALELQRPLPRSSDSYTQAEPQLRHFRDLKATCKLHF